jgi:lipopolysaccharide transport system permease protein
MVLLGALLIWYQFVPGWQIVFLPLFMLLALATALGAGVWVAALNVKYRDFKIIVPFIVQFGLYVSPVGFASSVVPDEWRLLYSLNPLVGVIDGFRWSLLGEKAGLYWPGLVMSLSVTGVLLVTGISYFRRTEKTFADVI